jgi:cytochrome b pre-mRNA-processing protein 3
VFFKSFMAGGAAKSAAARLYAETVAQARAPALYSQFSAPDTPEGRFELYTAHVVLVLERLRDQGAEAASLSQTYFDLYLSALDYGLRELAVGDLSVGKTMRKLGEAFYGRAKAMDEVLSQLPDRSPLEALLMRTVYGDALGADAAGLAAYLLQVRQDLAATPLERLLGGAADWRAAGAGLARR